MEKVKVTFTAALSLLFSWMGILAVPVFLLVGCNLIDYFTGLAAAPYREETISSYKGIRGIIKKVCMWLLIVVGCILDQLIEHAAVTVGLAINLPYLVSTAVAIWLICNEIISILENMIDIGADIPPFLMPLAKLIKAKTEEKTEEKEED